MNDTELAQLERLARLKADGVLTDAEYQAAKRSIMGGGAQPVDPTSALVERSERKLSKTWQFRFEFMSAHGMPSSPDFQRASKTLSMWQRRSLAFSPLAFFFGPIYFIILGLWRPAVTLIGVSILYAIVIGQLGLSEDLGRAALLAFGAVYALTCVPLYFLKETRRKHRWNPFFWLGSTWR